MLLAFAAPSGQKLLVAPSSVGDRLYSRRALKRAHEVAEAGDSGPTDRTAMHSGRSSRGRLECGRGGTVLVSAHFFSKSEDARLPVPSTCRTTAPGPERVTCATAVILKPAPRRAETVGDGRGAGGVARRRGVWAGRVAEGEKDAPCAGL